MPFPACLTPPLPTRVIVQVCVVCMDAPREVALVHGSTHHVITCLACTKALMARGGATCPICRAHIEDVLLLDA